MILFVLALFGLALVVVTVRFGFRWLLYAVGAWCLLWAWLILGSMWSPLGYAGYTFPFVVAAWFLRRRLARRIPTLARLLARFPRHHQKVLEQAFKDETDQEGKRVIPRVTGWERFDA